MFIYLSIDMSCVVVFYLKYLILQRQSLECQWQIEVSATERHERQVWCIYVVLKKIYQISTILQRQSLECQWQIKVSATERHERQGFLMFIYLSIELSCVDFYLKNLILQRQSLECQRPRDRGGVYMSFLKRYIKFLQFSRDSRLSVSDKLKCQRPRDRGSSCLSIYLSSCLVLTSI